MRKSIVEAPELEKAYMAENIFQVLRSIQQQLEKEVVSKQRTIERQEDELRKLRAELEQKNDYTAILNARLQDCQRNTDGSRQLINKLLNDIARLQQDVEWYKRTYETRSLLGTILEKLKRW